MSELRRSMPPSSLKLLILAAAVSLCAAAPALAVAPRPRAMVEDHAHYTGGDDWHVQLEVTRKASRFSSVVVYSQRCNATGFVQGAPLGGGGTFDVDAALPKGAGRFTVSGEFTSPVIAAGTWTITTADCEASGSFTAKDSTGHFMVGNPFEYPPRRIRLHVGLQRIYKTFRRNAWRFTPARARAAGYSFRGAPRCPALVHARKFGTNFWGEVLDPLAPQSLMYWCERPGQYRLAGAMFRAPLDKRPKSYDNLIRWHKHMTTQTANWMTHLWLTPSIVDAWATCSPFRAWERAGMWSYVPFTPIQETKPCTDTPGLGEPGGPG